MPTFEWMVLSMSGGDIAGLIAAGVFAVLVGFLAIPLLKLGKVLDETTLAIRDMSHNVAPLLEESTTTIQEANKQLARVDTITGNVADVTGNVSALVALFAATVGGPLIKLAGFSAAVRTAFRMGRPAPTASKRKR
jgi:cellulase/cellobiase CelA1